MSNSIVEIWCKEATGPPYMRLKSVYMRVLGVFYGIKWAELAANADLEQLLLVRKSTGYPPADPHPREDQAT